MSQEIAFPRLQIESSLYGYLTGRAKKCLKVSPVHVVDFLDGKLIGLSMEDVLVSRLSQTGNG